MLSWTKVTVAAALVGLACGSGGARAAEAQSASLQQAVQHGAEMFAHESFGGTGTCEMCHLNGGRTVGSLPDGRPVPSLAGAAAAFPRFSQRSQSVMTLSQQLLRCIAGALQGQPPALGSAELVDLETYVTSLSKGSVMGEQFK